MIALGGSAGALEALRQIVGGLPADLPASVFVALHQLPYASSCLAELLGKWGRLAARHPADREPLRPATLYVAPPDYHLLVVEGAVRVVQGPKEHNTRPAVDPLFRSAAVAYGPRVVGVVLSGNLDDGTAGLAAIDARGGVALVQDPADALYREMPENAARQVTAARRLKAAQMAPELARLAREPAAPPRAAAPPAGELEWVVAMAAWDLEAMSGAERPGRPSPFGCPECGGDLWELEGGGLSRFRCRTGHAYSPRSLRAAQAGAVDHTLNEAFRALKEKEHMERRLGGLAARHGNRQGQAYHEAQAAKAAKASAEVVRLLLHLRDAGTDAAPTEATGAG